MSRAAGTSPSSALIVRTDSEEQEVVSVLSSSSSPRSKVTTTRKRTVHSLHNEPNEDVESDHEVPEPEKKKRKSPLKGVKRMTKAASLQRYRELPDALVQKKWNEVILPSITKRMYGSDECWESRIATQGSGYCQLQLDGSGYGKQAGFYLTHLWSMRYHNRIPADLSHIGDPDCSHLCHNKRCVNPAHLIFEEGRNNKRRNVCPWRIDDVLTCPYIHHAPACLHAHSDFEVDGIRKFNGY